MKRLSCWLLNHYFYLMGLFGLGSMLNLFLLYKSSLLIFIPSLFLFFNYVLCKKLGNIDKLVIATMLYIIIVGIFNSYNFEYFYFGVRYVVGTMVFFFVGRSSLMIGDRFFINMLTPLIIIYIFALILFLYPPSWYLMWKTQNLNELVHENSVWEMLRLSGFWIYPYFISYSACLFSLFFIKKIVCNGQANVSKNWSAILFSILLLVLAGQRVALFYSLLCLGIGLFCILKRSVISKRNKIYIISFIVIIIGVLPLILVQYVSEDQLSFLMDRIASKNTDENIVVERFTMFSEFLDKDILLFGDGVGRYSHIANSDGNMAITDCQYLLILYENGIIGLAMFGLIFLFAIYTALKKWHYYIYELSVIIFYLIAFLGANALGSQEMHSAIFWICIGRVFNKEALEYKRVTKNYL